MGYRVRGIDSPQFWPEDAKLQIIILIDYIITSGKWHNYLSKFRIQISYMFSDQLIDQLSQFIIRPHRQIYGLDKLGPKKLIIKSASLGCYVQAYRQQSTILSEGKKIQLSIFQPYMKPGSNQTISQGSQNSNNLTRSTNGVSEASSYENSNQITIFLHTNSGSRLEGLQYCKYLLQHGHIVCLFDYSGSGVSEGQYVSMGLYQSRDLANVVRYLQQKYEIDKVNLWGRSMGAVTAVLYCSRYSRYVKKMVLDSPFCSFRQLVKQIVNMRTGLPEFLYGLVLNRIQQNIKNKLHANLMDIDLKLQIIKNGMQKIPIFFLISKDDKLVQPVHVQTLYQLHRGQKKILYLEGSHNKPRPSDIRQQCAEFLSNRINNASSQKVIEGHKRQYLTILSRKYSQDSTSSQQKAKLISSSLILNSPQMIDLPNVPQTPQTPQTHYLHGSQVTNGVKNYNSFNSSIQPPLFLNLIKKNNQSSAITTPREDHSVGKYQTKISLSQLKKNQIEGEPNGQFPMTTMPIQIPIQIQMQNRNTPTNLSNNGIISKGSGHIDFKKQSKTMAIQYKNKIKEHINKI